MHVVYVGPFAQPTGYAQAGHDYLLAMFRAGISLEIQPIVACNTDDLQPRYAELLPLVRGLPGHTRQPPTHMIVHTVPAHAPRFVEGAPKGVRLICLTTWETSALPSDMLARLIESFHEIWVPSEFCAEVMVDSDPDRVGMFRVVPHTFDSAHWHLVERPIVDQVYSFYSVLSWNERKNPIGLLKAYLSEFSKDDEVELTIKGSANDEDIIALINASGVSEDELPDFDFEPAHWSHADMVDMHDSCNCFVTAARGEGWNLPAFEAAIMGNPVISPSWGGQREFLDRYHGTVYVPQSLTPAVTPPIIDNAKTIGGLSVRAVKQIAPGGISIRQYWAEPDLQSLAKAMRTAYENRTWKSLESLAELESRFGYDTIGQQIKELLS